jgi:hypothetical protein
MSPDITRPLPHVSERRVCAFCPNLIGRDRRADALYCSETCRKRAFWARNPRVTVRPDTPISEIIEKLSR